MFKNTGKQIKSTAIWLMLCFSLLSLLGAIILWKIEQILIGILVLLLGISIAWSFLILLYGYGELIDETTKNRQESEKTNQLLAELVNRHPSQEENSASPAVSVSRNPSPAVSPPKNNIHFPEKKDTPSINITSGWLCPKCESRNSELTLACKTCGSPKDTKAQHNNGVVRKTTQNKITTESYAVPVTQTPVSTNGWICKECGKHNSSTAVICKSCGTAR